MDDLDRASALEIRQRQLAIQQVTTRKRQPSRTHCLDCDDPISAVRQRLGGVMRCMECDNDVQQLKRQQGYCA